MFKFPLLSIVREEAKEIAKRTRKTQMILNVSKRADPNKCPEYAIQRYRIMSEATFKERMVELVSP